MGVPVQGDGGGPVEQPATSGRRAVGLSALAAAFLGLGATTFGGMWGAVRQVERVVVERRAWIAKDELPFLLVAATLIPAPKFMALAGLIGYRLRRVTGSALAALSLVAPGALAVVAAVSSIEPDLLAGPLAPVRRAAGVAVVGITLGSAWRQIRNARARGRARLAGYPLALGVGAALAAGVPLLAVVAGGFAVGVVLVREGPAR